MANIRSEPPGTDGRPEIELANLTSSGSGGVLRENAVNSSETASPAEWPKWVYIATKTPLAAGSTGPLGLLVSVTGLAGPFRKSMNSEGKSTNEDKPGWVIGMTACALSLEIIGNVALFLNFYGRVSSYRTTMTISLTAFSLNLGMLLSVIIAFILLYPQDSPDLQIHYAQGYWLTISATILAFFTSTFLLLNYLGYRNEYYKSFTLSLGQRLLVMQNMLFLLWVALGALIFALIEDGLSFMKALYFINVSLLTVGFGDGVMIYLTGEFDITMHTSLGRAILIPYTFIGIALLGLVVAAIRNVVVEDARERLIQRHLNNIRRKGQFGIVAGLRRGSGMTTIAMVGQVSDTELNEQFQEMRKRQKKMERSRAFMATGITIGVFVTFWVGGAAIFATTENWTFFEGFYFAFVSLITIGYGDYTVGTDPGRAVFILWSLMAVPLMTILVSSVGDTFINILQEKTKKQVEDGTSGVPTSSSETRLGYTSDSDREFQALGRRLPETEAELEYFVQHKLPQELVMLSRKLVKYAEDVSSKVNYKYSFDEFKEMRNDTGVDYGCGEIITLLNEELVFLKNYRMAIERVVGEMKAANERLAAIR